MGALGLSLWLPPSRLPPPAYTGASPQAKVAEAVLSEAELTRGCRHFSLLQAMCHPQKSKVSPLPPDACEHFVRVFEQCPGRGTYELTPAPVNLHHPLPSRTYPRASAGQIALWRVAPLPHAISFRSRYAKPVVPASAAPAE
ncbi:uncharacterized protein AMSG_04467 [Thecamonas trahens ATCC 50062]|uniref:Uncharacterized protein n=1 Tax=Thecamonas trahens ATCC 50062 TaxID=461836 RepID=A0A0L0D847_THETB|nr:hypothetical protein AMSG_04467 [Thecamonas trahens ATCC 50062]KNC48236.1 hypothetical protein AMSG_04467 [Thecamonas trahens ATCC 50062]|eukprot:XP_013758805.1 hypothetical protein AMSG_04467 [Thecamonas trahens ATCC 50062]